MSIDLMISILALALLLFSVAQFGMVIGFCTWLSRFKSSVHHGSLPHAAVILSVRGESDSLPHCLHAMETLDYPRYEMHVIVDNVHDAAMQCVETWKESNSPVPKFVHILKEISPFSSLKTSAVRQCIGSLDTRVEAIAILDADTVPHREWLANLIAPLGKENFGASTGNRWYDSTAPQIGNQIRFLYNAWAVPGMHFMNTIWGGSLGISKAVFTDPEFLSRFANTPTEETGVQWIRNKRKLMLAQQGNVIMWQRGEVTVPDAFGFITRQLVWTRLHYREWIGVLLGPLVIYLSTVLLTVVPPSRYFNVIGGALVSLCCCSWHTGFLIGCLSSI